MNKNQIGKVCMMVLGTVLTLGASLVNEKNQEVKMNETVAKKVEEALKNQTKES